MVQATDADLVLDGEGKQAVTAAGDDIEVMMLGAGQEVGRSCCVIKYKGATVVCDAGWHPGLTGWSALPFIDELDWSTVDCILVTHFHIDHAASLPYIMEKTNFKQGGGKVYMTSATRDVYGILMKDFVRMSEALATDNKIFDEQSTLASFQAIQPVGFGEEVFVPSRSDALETTISSSAAAPPITFTSYPAGHVLGAAMFLIQIAGARILYTGDYSTEEDRHLIPASLPIWSAPPDVMVCESTFGVQVFEGRESKEPLLTETVKSILKRGGRVLMPVFALGRAQEILLILDEYWAAHPELERYPIYYISSLASRCMKVYLSHTASLNADVQARADAGDHPFNFRRGRFVKELKDVTRTFSDKEPCVVLASPGFLTNGVSRQLLEKWAPDKRNGLILTGYSVEGTLARELGQKQPETIETLEGKRIPRRMTINSISFAAHVDFEQNQRFIDEVKPAHLILVHGEYENMRRCKEALKSNYATRKQDVQIYTPRNTERLRIRLARNRIARAVGKLAQIAPVAGGTINGLLVSKDSTYTLVAPDDLNDFTGLTTSIIAQRQRIRLQVGWELVRYHLEGMYGTVQAGVDKEGTPTIRVMGVVDVKHSSTYEMLIEWIGSTSNDMIADSVLALLLGIDSSPASVKLTTTSHSHHQHPHAESLPVKPTEGADIAKRRLDRLIAFLNTHFGDVQLLSPDEAAQAIAREVKAAQDDVDAKVDDADEAKADVDMVGPAASTPKPGEDAIADEMVDERVKSEEGEVLPPPVEPLTAPALRVRVDDHSAFVLLSSMGVESDFEPLKKRVQSVVLLAVELCTPLSAGSWLQLGGAAETI